MEAKIEVPVAEHARLRNRTRRLRRARLHRKGRLPSRYPRTHASRRDRRHVPDRPRRRARRDRAARLAMVTCADIAGLQQPRAETCKRPRGATKETRLIAPPHSRRPRASPGQARRAGGRSWPKLPISRTRCRRSTRSSPRLAGRMGAQRSRATARDGKPAARAGGQRESGALGLESADQRLSGIERPGFMALRKTLASESSGCRRYPKSMSPESACGSII